jgi:hypothetical protein
MTDQGGYEPYDDVEPEIGGADAAPYGSATYPPERESAAARPTTYPGGVGDPASVGSRTGGRILCAHADDDGAGMHWLEPGETCSAARRRETAGCKCTPARCTRGEFRDHQGASPGCMACADLDPDQPCYAAMSEAGQ